MDAILYAIEHPKEHIAFPEPAADDTAMVHGQLLSSDMLVFGARLLQTVERDEKKWRTVEFQKTLSNITNNDTRFGLNPDPILFFSLSTLLGTIATLRLAWRTPLHGRRELVEHLFARTALLLCLKWDTDMLDVEQYRAVDGDAVCANAALLWDMEAMFSPMMQTAPPVVCTAPTVDTDAIGRFVTMIVSRMQGDSLPQEYYQEHTRMNLLAGDDKLFKRRRPNETKPSYAQIVRELRGVVFAHKTHAHASRLLRTIPPLEESLIRSCLTYYCRQKNILTWNADDIVWEADFDKFRVGKFLCESYAHAVTIQNPVFLTGHTHRTKRRKIQSAQETVPKSGAVTQT
jgi:hypothetical protein